MLRLVYISIAIAVWTVPLAMGCDSGGSKSIPLDAAVIGADGTTGGGGGATGTGGTGGVKPGTGGSGGAGGVAGSSPAPYCGDNMINGSEQCDGTDLGGATCESLAGTGLTGIVSCTNTCTYDDSQCSAVGDAAYGS